MPDTTAVTTGRFYESPIPGQVQVIRELYTADGVKAAGSVIRFVPAKKGMRIVDMKIKCSAFGASRTIDVGDGGDVDRFLDGGDVSAAAVIPCNAAAGFFYQYTEDDTIDVTVLGDTMPDGATLELIVTYTMNQ